MLAGWEVGGDRVFVRGELVSFTYLKECIEGRGLLR